MVLTGSKRYSIFDGAKVAAIMDSTKDTKLYISLT